MLLGTTNVINHQQPSNSKVKLLDQVRITLRTNHYSKKTEEAYLSWIKRYNYDHECKNCGAMYIPYDTRIRCPQCNLLEEEKDELNWEEVGWNAAFQWTPELIAKFEKYIVFGGEKNVVFGNWTQSLGLSINCFLNCSFETLVKYEKRWSYNELLIRGGAEKSLTDEITLQVVDGVIELGKQLINVNALIDQNYNLS